MLTTGSSRPVRPSWRQTIFLFFAARSSGREHPPEVDKATAAIAAVVVFRKFLRDEDLSFFKTLASRDMIQQAPPPMNNTDSDQTIARHPKNRMNIVPPGGK